MRAAVGHAIDRPRLIDSVLAKTARPMLSLVPEQLLTSSLPSDHSSPPTTPPGTDRIAIELWYSTHYGDTEAAVAGVIRDMLQDGGRFSVTLRSAQWAEYKAALSRGQYGLFLLGWYPDVLDADDYLWPFAMSASSRTIGSNYANGETDALLKAQRTSIDPVARRELLRRALERIHADVAYIPLWQTDQIAAVRSDVRGLRLSMDQTLRVASLR